MDSVRKCLSYNDVLLCPRNSELEHLSDADIKVMYTVGMHEIYPIINAPMDKVCSVPLIKFMDRHSCATTIHRWFNSPQEQLEFFKSCEIEMSPRCFLAVGNISKWKEWIDVLLEERKNHLYSFLVDMANGDSKACIETVKYIKQRIGDDAYGNIMAGNVATKSSFRRLQEAGANFIRVGIGGGCFAPNMKVNTTKGNKNISEVQNGDLVFTHTGECKEIIATISYYSEEVIMKINDDIECTKNHEFYVIHKKYKNEVNENNIHKFAQWIRAEDLNEDYFMIELE